MKRLHISIFIFSFALIVILMGCSKERLLNIYYSLPLLNKYLQSKQQTEQIFNITEPSSRPIIGAKGTALYVSKDIFMYPNGDSVSYPFSIGLIELYSPKDRIYYGISSVADNDILATAGDLRIRAFKNSDELVLRPGASYKLETASLKSTDEKAKIYHGTGTPPYVTWAVSTDTVNIIDSKYQGYISKMGWINFAYHFQNTVNNSKLVFTSSVGDTLSQVGIYVYLPETQTLLTWGTDSLYSIHDSTSIEVVSIAVDTQDKLYKFFQKRVVSTTNTIELDFTETTDEELTKILESL